LVIKFRLNPIKGTKTPLLQDWLDAPLPTLTASEQELFEKYLARAAQNISGWNE